MPASTSAFRETSPEATETRPPSRASSRAVAAAASGSRSKIPTAQPSARSRAAMGAPDPEGRARHDGPAAIQSVGPGHAAISYCRGE